MKNLFLEKKTFSKTKYKENLETDKDKEENEFYELFMSQLDTTENGEQNLNNINSSLNVNTNNITKKKNVTWKNDDILVEEMFFNPDEDPIE